MLKGRFAEYDTADLKGLLRRTQREYDKARQRFEILSTAAETGEYQKILDILDAESDDSKLTPLVGPGQEYLGTKTIREAKKEIREMAQSYSRRKADGYLEAARVYYEANQPVAADK